MSDAPSSPHSTLVSPRKTIGLFGGTFDPVHNGHLQIAKELKQSLQLDEMRLVPCHIPPHRRETIATVEQRTEMLSLAVAIDDDFIIDEIELHNPNPSYSVHTLMELRKLLGEEVSLCLSMGMDSLVNLSSWYRWQDLLRLAHILVAARPGWSLPQDGVMAGYLQQHQGNPEELILSSCGKIIVQELTMLPISSTEIRTRIEKGDSVEHLLPPPVWEYIKKTQLYG